MCYYRGTGNKDFPKKWEEQLGRAAFVRFSTVWFLPGLQSEQPADSSRLSSEEELVWKAALRSDTHSSGRHTAIRLHMVLLETTCFIALTS